MNELPEDHEKRLQRARLSLDGLSIGDAFGEKFFFPEAAQGISERELAGPPWHFTDDSVMACGIYTVLKKFGEIDQDALAEAFAHNYASDPMRGYGGMAHRILTSISEGQSWKRTSCAAFGGTGSMGNGGAMRVAPLGAYFAFAEPAEIVRQARHSAEVTHAHAEGQAGAAAIALGAAWCELWHEGEMNEREMRLIDFVYQYMPEGDTREAIGRARELPLDSPIQEAVGLLGNGSRIIAPDTAPFCVWIASSHFRNYEEALWQTVSAGGDLDTNAAIVGGMVILSAKEETVPAEWLDAREPLGEFLS